MTAITHFLGKVVLADLGSYAVSGRLLSCRGDDLTLETRSGSRILATGMRPGASESLQKRGGTDCGSIR